MDLKIKESTVIEMVSHVLAVDVENIKPSSRLEEDLGADSLDRSELALMVEDNFDIRLPHEHTQNWVTVGDVVSAVIERSKKAVTA